MSDNIITIQRIIHQHQMGNGLNYMAPKRHVDDYIFRHMVLCFNNNLFTSFGIWYIGSNIIYFFPLYDACVSVSHPLWECVIFFLSSGLIAHIYIKLLHSLLETFHLISSSWSGYFSNKQKITLANKKLHLIILSRLRHGK